MSWVRTSEAGNRRRFDGLWAVAVCVALGSAVTGTVMRADLASYWQKWTAPSVAPRAAIEEQVLRTGSILFIPRVGDVCHTHLFDNTTGRIWHNGSVDCETALTKPAATAQSKGWSFARTEAIRGGFRQ